MSGAEYVSASRPLQGANLKTSTPLRRRGMQWTFVTSARTRDAEPAASVLRRTPRAARADLDPLSFRIRWAPLQPPADFAADVSAVLERMAAARAAYLATEVLLKDGLEVQSWARLHVDWTGRGGLERTFDDLSAVGIVARFSLTRRYVTPIFRRGDAAAQS